MGRGVAQPPKQKLALSFSLGTIAQPRLAISESAPAALRTSTTAGASECKKFAPAVAGTLAVAFALSGPALAPIAALGGTLAALLRFRAREALG